MQVLNVLYFTDFFFSAMEPGHDCSGSIYVCENFQFSKMSIIPPIILSYIGMIHNES